MDFIGYKKICKKFWNSKTGNLGYKKGKDFKKKIREKGTAEREYQILWFNFACTYNSWYIEKIKWVF